MFAYLEFVYSWDLEMLGNREIALGGSRLQRPSCQSQEGFSWPAGVPGRVGLQNVVPLEINGLYPHLWP